MSGGEYELIYEGPADDSADTLRRIKKTLVGELSFSIEETKEFLEKTPATLFTADDEHSLDEYYHILKKAGARVYIVKPRSKKTEAVEFEVALDFEEEKKQAKVFDVSEDVSLEDNLPIYEPQEEEHEAPKVNTKAFVIADDDASLEHIISNLSEEENEYDISPKIDKLNSADENKENVHEGENFSFDSSPSKIEVPLITEPIPLKAEDPIIEEKKSDDFSFSFDSAEPQERKVETKQSEVTPPQKAEESKATAFDLSFEVDEPQQKEEAKAEISAKEEVTEKSPQSWDLSIDIPKPTKQEETEPTPNEASKKQTADDILNEFDPNQEEDKPKREEVIVPPLAEALSHKKSSAPQESKNATNAKAGAKEEPTKQGSRDIFFIALIGTIMLWIGNHWYFSNQDQYKTEIDQTAASIPKAPKKEKKPLEAAPEKNTLIGTTKGDFGEIEATIVEQKGKILQISVSFKGVESPPLSPEQIVNGYKKRPWIEQIRFDPTGLETDINGEVKVSGPARISINDDSEVKRLIGTGELTAKLQDKTVNLKFGSQYGTKQNSPGVLVKRTENGLITSVSVDTTIALNPK